MRRHPRGFLRIPGEEDIDYNKEADLHVPSPSPPAAIFTALYLSEWVLHGRNKHKPLRSVLGGER